MENFTWSEIQAGDKRAFRVLFDEYYSSLCLYANSIVHDIELSQDIVSECFVRIWERRESIEIESSIKYYLLISVRNSIYGFMRSPESRKTDINTVIARLENTAIEEYNLEKDETIYQLSKLIEQLPEQRKNILELAAFKGKTYTEIAEQLNISVNTVKTQMARAYRFLRDGVNSDQHLLWFLFRKI
ncbi:RNA polymerase sigma-70 factor [uncultured Draconibacterium sp.]|uniref:RNA polymerase sigma-70 factor n=1 Tax=uncultured Draconibacterium sp. TaxID=1573823 RepID=UPI00321806F3